MEVLLRRLGSNIIIDFYKFHVLYHIVMISEVLPRREHVRLLVVEQALMILCNKLFLSRKFHRILDMERLLCVSEFLSVHVRQKWCFLDMRFNLKSRFITTSWELFFENGSSQEWILFRRDLIGGSYALECTLHIDHRCLVVIYSRSIEFRVLWSYMKLTWKSLTYSLRWILRQLQGLVPKINLGSFDDYFRIALFLFMDLFSLKTVFGG